MRWIRYSQFVDDDFGISAEDLMRALADYFLQSGFQDPYGGYPFNEDSLDMLREAIRQALENGELIPPGEFEKLTPEQVEALIERLIEKLMTDGYVSEPASRPGREGEAGGEVRVETTDKALDFLGYKTLKDLLGSLGRRRQANGDH